MTPYQRQIRKLAQNRGVTQLFHFTPDFNVRSILTHGLAARPVLDANNIDYAAPDGRRDDGCLDALSVSIHSINKPMLAEMLKKYSCDWAIIAIDASVLWSHRCRFCWTNAASNSVRKAGPLDQPDAFKRMFEDWKVGSLTHRRREARQDYEPSDLSAEVQVFDPIGPNLIVKAIVETGDLRTDLVLTV